MVTSLFQSRSEGIRIRADLDYRSLHRLVYCSDIQAGTILRFFHYVRTPKLRDSRRPVAPANYLPGPHRDIQGGELGRWKCDHAGRQHLTRVSREDQYQPVLNVIELAGHSLPEGRNSLRR